MEKNKDFNLKTVLFLLIALLFLYFLKNLDYLFFHSFVEVFGVLVSGAIFMVVFNTRDHFDNKYFLFVAIGYLFMSFIDLFHMMSFGDANIIKGPNDVPTQLWILARYLQALTLVTVPFLIGKKINYRPIFAIFAIICGAGLLSILYFKNFPVCYIDDVGLTPFKIFSEYAISGLFLFSILLLYKKKGYFHKRVFDLLVISIIFGTFSELAFTNYKDVTGLYNFLGHCFKLASFYFFYKASIEIGLREPYAVLFSELAMSEKRYKAIVHDQSEMIKLWKPGGVVVFANRAYCEYFGVDIKAIAGQTFFPEIAENGWQNYEKNINELTAEKPTNVNEINIKFKNELRWQRWTNRALFDEKNNIVEYLSVGLDITERKLNEEKLAWLASFPEYNPNPVVELTMAGEIKYINFTGVTLLPGLVRLKTRHPFLAEWDRTVSVFKGAKQGNFGREILVESKWYFQVFYYVPLTQCVRIYAMDITERKLAEEHIEKSYRNMEEMVKERTMKLAEANEKLIFAKRLSDIGELSAIVAHELRNPLAAMRIAAYNIKRKANSGIFDKNLANIQKKIEESNQIINNLLFYSRIKEPKYDSVDLILVLKECLDLAVSRYSRKKLKVTKKYNKLRSLIIEADPLQTKELFMNLINNACDAMFDGKGRLEAAVLVDDLNAAVIIKDNGAGISRESLKKISEPFFTTKAKGTGLGLSVCFQVVKLHKGAIDFKSEENSGTTVEVKLPLRKS